jgi:hypothetical protein
MEVMKMISYTVFRTTKNICLPGDRQKHGIPEAGRWPINFIEG